MSRFALRVQLALLIIGGLCGLLLGPQQARAQEFRGTISGAVTDSSGAVVPGAHVVARENSTGTLSRATTNASGQYVLPFLLPGRYSVTVTAKGFKTLVHPGIILQSQDHPIINITLKPGEVSETVTVRATTPLLDMANASVSSVITTRSVADLPLNGRTPTTLAELAPGVITTGPPQLIHPFDNNAGNQWSISGTPNQVSEVLLDGAPDLTELGALAYAPTEDSVKEVSIRPFDTDASFGHTIGGVINQITKSGTNNLHGTLYWFNQVPNLDGNLWFNGLRNPVPKLPVTHYNQYGLTVGGPIWIPHLYNGRNKLFFFFAWEGLKDSQPVQTTVTVPTAAEKGGDFGQTLAAEASNQMYDPFTAIGSGSKVTRGQPIPGNNLATLGVPLNPIALNYLKLFPAPNTTGQTDGEDNYISNAPSVDTYNNEFGRLDYNASVRDHVFFDFRHNIRAQTKDDFFGNGATGTILDRENFGSTLDNVFDLNATTFFDTRLNWVYFNEVHTSPSVKYTPTQMGFPGYMAKQSTLPQLPYINFGTGGSCGSHTSYQCLGNNSAAMDPTTSYQLFADMVKVIGRHTLKIGFDGRRYLMTVQNFGASSGSFQFNSNWLNSGSSGVSNIFGADMAAFLLGLPSNGTSSSGTGSQYDINARGDYHQYYVGAFVQDDWRVSDHLSINAGLRFDIDTPFTEKMGRTVNGFNPTATINYVKPPAFSGASVSQAGVTYTVPSINTLGGLTYPSASDGAVYKTNSGFLSPRFGFSYAIGNNTDVRGGFGIFVMPETLATLAATGSYSSNALSNQEGFSQTTPLDATNDNYTTPSSSNILANPYPSGLLPPVGSSMGATTFLGNSISFLAPVQHDSYSERWNLGVQRQLTSNTMLEALYVGNHAVHLPIATQDLNAVSLQYLSKTPWLNPNMEAAYNQQVSNPFYGTFPAVNGIPNTASMNKNSKVSISSLMVPYPQFGAVNIENQTRGQSWFNSAILYLQHRTSHGLTLTANYSFSKLIEQDTFLNNEDLAPVRRISPFDHTHHFTAGATYDLPFGRGKMFSLGGSRLWDEVAGGWVINGIYQFQSGAPVVFSSDIPLQPGVTLRQIRIKPRDTSQNQRTGALSPLTTFVTEKNTSVSKCAAGSACDGTTYYPGQYFDHYRTLPQTMSWVRADGYNNLDASILKNFNFSEGRFLQLRFETFNTLNHPIFEAPNVSSPTSGSFGLITSTTKNSLPRQVQLGARIVF